jgi:hypothetical protein
MKLFSLAIFLAFVARSVLSEVSWACNELMGDTVTPTNYVDMMVMKRSEASDSEPPAGEARKGVKGALPKGFKQSKLKGSKKGNNGKGAKKGGKKGKKRGNKGKKGNTGGPVVERKCSIAQKSLSFVVFPDRENPLLFDVDAPAAGIVFFLFGDDFIGFQTQTLIVLAGGAIMQGQDTFEFFDVDSEELVGAITTQFGNGIPIITGGTGIFLGAVGEPVISTDNEFDAFQLLFDICVSARAI